MKHFAGPAFWDAYRKLPERVRECADKNFALLKQDPQHASLHLKKVGRYFLYVSAFDIGLSPLKSTPGYFGSGSAPIQTMTRC